MALCLALVTTWRLFCGLSQDTQRKQLKKGRVLSLTISGVLFQHSGRPLAQKNTLQYDGQEVRRGTRRPGTTGLRGSKINGLFPPARIPPPKFPEPPQIGPPSNR